MFKPHVAGSMLMPSLPLMEIAIGFSVGMALLLIVAQLTVYRGVELPWPSRLGGLVMLLGLALTQLGHLQMLQSPALGVTRSYAVVLFLQSLGFYWLILGVLRERVEWPLAQWLLLPGVVALAWLTPLRWTVPAVLVLASMATLHLCVLCYRLRSQRQRFRLEIAVIALFGAMAAACALAGLLAPGPLGWDGFAQIYGILIALGFLLVGWLLLAVPDLVPKAREAVAVAYAQSTLGRIDRTAALQQLRKLLEDEHVYRDENLSLGGLAELLDLSSHQLSELINTQLQVSFSRLIRQHRVAAARRMLIAEPKASVLSVGLAVGFSSQSTFYVAFKDEVGVVPGKYRQQQASAVKSASATA